MNIVFTYTYLKDLPVNTDCWRTKNPLLKFVISIITMNKHFDIYKTWSPAILMLILKLDGKCSSGSNIRLLELTDGSA
jgi:hypothetical protein